MEKVKISLFNSLTDTLYELLVSAEEAERAGRDMAFATALLERAMGDTVAQNAGPARADNHTPTPESDEEDQDSPNIDTAESTVSVYRWSAPCVLLLLETYRGLQKKLTNGKQPQKRVWEEIANIMAEKGYSLTGPQCSAKMRSLKKTYKAVKDENNKSGNDRRTWQFFEVMDELFSKSAWCKPVAVASSSGQSSQTAATLAAASSTAASDGGNEDEPMNRTPTVNSLLLKRIRLKEKSEEQKAKRHKERMEMEEKRLAMDARILTVLENLTKRNIDGSSMS